MLQETEHFLRHRFPLAAVRLANVVTQRPRDALRETGLLKESDPILQTVGDQEEAEDEYRAPKYAVEILLEELSLRIRRQHVPLGEDHDSLDQRPSTLLDADLFVDVVDAHPGEGFIGNVIVALQQTRPLDGNFPKAPVMAFHPQIVVRLKYRG